VIKNEYHKNFEDSKPLICRRYHKEGHIFNTFWIFQYFMECPKIWIEILILKTSASNQLIKADRN